MSFTATQSSSGYLQDLLSGQPAVPASKQAWLNKLRSVATETVSELTIPTLRDEEWRFTDLSMLTKMSLQPVHAAIHLEASDIKRFHMVLADNGCEVTVIEDYVSLQDEAYFTNAVTEFVLADHARVHHIRVQREGAKAFHIGSCAATLSRSSNYQSVSIAMGARLSRYNLNIKMAEGSECSADGLALISARQLADTHTLIDHAQPHGTSRQLHKCIVGGGAHAVFNGKIMVRHGAIKTDSEQSSKTLLLTDKAHVDTKPQLEIFNDDVKCTHGATIGQLDNEEVFYLRSRGVSEEQARNMLTYAFGAEVIERIPVVSLKRSLEKTVMQQTSVQL